MNWNPALRRSKALSSCPLNCLFSLNVEESFNVGWGMSLRAYTSILGSTKIILSKCVATFMGFFFLLQNKLILTNLRFKLVFWSVCIYIYKTSSQRCFILTAEPTEKCLWWKPSSFQVYFYLEIRYSAEQWI